MLETSTEVLLLDYFRAPYSVAASGGSGSGGTRRPLPRSFDYAGVAGGGGRHAVWWPRAGSLAEARDLGELRLNGIPVFAAAVPDGVLERTLERTRERWERAFALEDRAGHRVASAWRGPDGSVCLPFDPSEAIENVWSERYHGYSGGSRLASHAARAARRAYYAARPLLPRSAQIGLRRALTRVQERSRFPRWPVETALHDLYEVLLGLLAGAIGRPVPTIAAWPDGYEWALVLTHDVETEKGYARVRELAGLEASLGYRSSWNFVPRRYDVEDELVAALKAGGHEVGVHGLYHDGLDLASRATLEARLPEIRAWASRWGSTGFRSPATRRRWELMPLLGFDYDSSYPDTDPYEPDAGGCCSWLPFTNDGIVELPITLPQDHTLFVLLRRPGEGAWVEKTSFLREHGGMALLITHPDYLDPEALGSYRRFLERFRDDESAWCALPCDVCAWWRRRDGSRLEPSGDGWTIAGPAAGEARVHLVEGSSPGA